MPHTAKSPAARDSGEALEYVLAGWRERPKTNPKPRGLQATQLAVQARKTQPPFTSWLPDRAFHGQAYRRVGEGEYRKRNGQVVMWPAWQSFCADCLAPFVCLSPEEPFSPSRRCEICKKPGFRVNPQRKRRSDGGS